MEADDRLESAHGLIIIYAKLSRPDIRKDFWSHMENLLGERISRTVFELNISDWDEGNWQEEVAWIEDLLAGTDERVIVWQFIDGKYSRFSLTGNSASE